MIALILAGAAIAAPEDCPWYGADSVNAFATGKSITVNGQMFAIKGDYAKGQFMSILNDCNAGAAAALFNDWRNMRKWTAITGVGGCCIWPAWIGTIVTAVSAGSKKQQMLMMLNNSTPPGPNSG